MNLVADVGFDQSFSFIYSARPGTPAADLADDTPLDIKKERLQRLQDRLRAQAERHGARLCGSVQTVLVHGASKRDPSYWQGRTECNRVVNFSGRPAGHFAQVRIVEALPNSLRGTLLDERVAA